LSASENVDLLPYWQLSQKGNPTRVIEDTRLTVCKYLEDPSRYSFVVGDVWANCGYETKLRAERAAEDFYFEHKGKIVFASAIAWIKQNARKLPARYGSIKNDSTCSAKIKLGDTDPLIRASVQLAAKTADAMQAYINSVSVITQKETSKNC
jgi:hypothetical protein